MLQGDNIDVLEGPPYSPGLDSIEYLVSPREVTYVVLPDVKRIKGKEQIQKALGEDLLIMWERMP